MRGRSYSPSPPRGYGRRGRSPSPRGRYGGRSRDLPTSLLVRNLRHDCRPEDLRRPFEQFGALKDIYLPRDYYTGEPRGFGFVQYADPHDAAEAKHHMDGRVLLGRELTVVFAEENRKKPMDMRTRERTRGRFRDRRRSPPRYSRSPRHSRSPPPRHARSPSRSREYYSPPPKRRHHSRIFVIEIGYFLWFVTCLATRPTEVQSYLFHPKRGGTVKRGHIQDQGATAKLQLGAGAGAQLGAGAGAQLGAGAAAQEEAQITMNILGKQMEKDLLVLEPCMETDVWNAACLLDYVY
ncbi:hypothetical protein POTOM_003614 [Populus tomentosa]|uniref:RRM domain-containing protein n=1 Tax=Populus tomentosa TaxID=118781 RepID=A0A8X8ADG5_POPTO|nr:hypothetical protein POTOM_003614 [Populus tomentosa]